MGKILIILTLFIFSCDEEPQLDCAGIEGGSASLDDCGLCIGGTTGLIADYSKDCAGECGGSAVMDCEGVCNGNNGQTDNCGICDPDPLNDCTQDCNGHWGGTLEYDECGTCGGPGLVYAGQDCDYVTDCGYVTVQLGSNSYCTNSCLNGYYCSYNDQCYFNNGFESSCNDGRTCVTTEQQYVCEDTYECNSIYECP